MKEALRMKFSIILPLLFLIFASLSFPLPAFAYLDPGSGSMLLQLLMGGVVGVIAILKLYWQSFTGLFKGKSAGQTHSDPPESER